MKTLLLIISFGVLSQAYGTPIVYTWSGTGTGELGTELFVDTHFLITAMADTSDASNNPPFSGIPVQSATVQVDGFDVGQFEIGLRLFRGPYYSVPPGQSGDETLGLSLATGPDLLNLFSHAFVGYDLTTDLGPVFVPVPDYQRRLSFNDIPTSLGPMTLTSSLNVTFTATLIPEPSTLALSGLGSLSLVMARRKR